MRGRERKGVCGHVGVPKSSTEVSHWLASTQEVTEAESYKEDVLYFKIHPPEDHGLLDCDAIYLCMVQEWLLAVHETSEMVSKTGDMHVVVNVFTAAKCH